MSAAENRLTSRLDAFDGPARIAFVAGIGLVVAVVASTFGLGVALIALAGLGLATLALVPPRPATVATTATAAADQTDAQGLIDAFQNPVLIVVGDQVAAANASARTLLGVNLVGENVRTALRDPAASDHLAGATSEEPIELGQLGGRETLWVMTARRMTDGRRVIHLVDRSQRLAFERARTEFVANASHELRTPLAAILGFVETLTDDRAGADAKTRGRFLGVIQSEARRMQALVDDLMSLSRIEAEKYQRPTTETKLTDIARQAVEERRDSAGRRRENIELTVAPDTPPILGDRAQLLQVIHNLIDNAEKYGRSGGRIAVDVRPLEGRRIGLTVSDQGDGIAPEHLPRLTERFYRVDTGRSRASGGTGLGLAIVKHIVERHRGRLEIESQIGVGTTVKISLPQATSV